MKEHKIPPMDSIEKLARFWDSHSLTEFEDQLEEVDEGVESISLLIPPPFGFLGFVGASELAEHLGESGPGVELVGLELDGSPELLHGLRPLALATEGFAEVVVGAGLCGIEGDRLPEGLGRFIELALLAEGGAEIVEEGRVVGPEMEGLAVEIDGGGVVALAVEAQAPVVPARRAVFDDLGEDELKIGAKILSSRLGETAETED